MTLVLSRIRVEDRDATIAVPIRNEDFIRLRVVSGLGRQVKILRVVAARALSRMADLEEEFAVLAELQHLGVAFAVSSDPEVPFRVD